MFKPTVGEVLEGVIEGLRHSVLPAVPPGAAERQLRAAIHALGRVQRSWDLLPEYLQADAADMRATLDAVLAACAARDASASSRLAQRLEALDAAGSDDATKLRGVNCTSLAAQGSAHQQLQRRLIEVDSWMRANERRADPVFDEQVRRLDELHLRMSDRQVHAWGVAEAET